MKKNLQTPFSSYIKKHYKIITVILTVFLLAGFYFFIRTRSNNHLSYTHIMYVVIVFSSSILGVYFGIWTAIIAGLLVGPLMPYNLITGESQHFTDWFFRLIMMVVVGSMSGYFSKNYRYVQQKIKDLYHVNPETSLNNINYLDAYNLDDDHTYLIMTMLISNYKTVVDVSGYKTYYMYLNKIKDILNNLHEDTLVVQSDHNKLWFLTKLDNYNNQINLISNAIKKMNQVNETKLFIDFGLGFNEIRYDKKLTLSTYFIDTDVAARQAIFNHSIYQKYTSLETKKKDEYELLSEFEDALVNGQIYMTYQPKYNLKTRKPVGLEALIRWHHPIKKMIYPDQFIPAVEATSLVHKMTEEVFRKSLTYHEALKKVGLEIPISINISSKNLYDIKFYNQMINIFSEFNIKPGMVELEITETVLMEKPQLSKEILEKFARFGFRIAIDDFGKGHSSLAYLAQFPIHTIKIDRFFTKSILVSPTTQAIVQATINLAIQLGYEVLIEGIEDKETADLLESYGCHTAQGYYFMKPEKELIIKDYLRTSYKK